MTVICNKCGSKLNFVPSSIADSRNLNCQKCDLFMWHNENPQYVTDKCIFNFSLNKNKFQLESILYNIKNKDPFGNYKVFEFKEYSSDDTFPNVIYTKDIISQSKFPLIPKLEKDILLTKELIIRLKNIITLI